MITDDPTDLITDDPTDLLDAINELIALNQPFAIVTCRSGLTIDIYQGDATYALDTKRLAYTCNNNNSLAKTIREAISKVSTTPE